jgi:hypothetical protein
LLHVRVRLAGFGLFSESDLALEVSLVASIALAIGYDQVLFNANMLTDALLNWEKPVEDRVVLVPIDVEGK